MERVLSDEEKFRRAEEIYNRRRNLNVTLPSSSVNRSVPKKEKKRLKKMLIQIGVCVAIYFAIYFIQYSNLYFSNDFVKKVDSILVYDINFNEKYLQIKDFFSNNNFFKSIFLTNKDDKKTEETNLENYVIQNIMNEVNTAEEQVIENSILENNINSEINLETQNTAQENTAQINTSQDSIATTEENLGTGGGETSVISSDDEQMKKDAQAIKEKYKITLPLRGTVTSRFGKREIEPKFHTGIDIARNTGSEIISATNGKVILVEEQAAYGKVLKIQNENLVTLYAHCSEILVNEGDKISIMQKIAKVGSTGNSTGPHLHFEIIYCGRYVNPEYVLGTIGDT